MSIKLKITEDQYIMLKKQHLKKSGAKITMNGQTFKNVIQHIAQPKLLDIYKSIE